eukprot:scaffold55584_cov78-Phaeocystis_antarctica.AAC.2
MGASTARDERARATAEAPPPETAQRAASHHTMVRASMGASTARDERARAAAEAPPPERAQVQPRTTRWCAPA